MTTNNDNDPKWYLVNNSSVLKEDFLQNAQLQQTNQYKELFRLKSDGIEENKQIDQSDWVKISETGEVHVWVHGGNGLQWYKTGEHEGVENHPLKEVPYWVYGTPTYVYEFIVNVPHHSDFGHHINDFLVDGVISPAGSVVLYQSPDRGETPICIYINSIYCKYLQEEVFC